MVRGKRIGDDLRKVMIEKFLQGISPSHISRILSIPRKSVSGIISRYNSTGSTAEKKKSGRKSKLTNRKKAALKSTIASNRKDNLANISMQLETKTGLKVSRATCSRWIRRIGYKFYKVLIYSLI